MSSGPSHGGPAISLDQLVALNDEIAALIRAGIPLDQGLIEMGADMPGRLGTLAQLLGERMRRGESLPQILASEPRMFPEVWHAVVVAGLQAGNLPAALEALSSTARRLVEIRRAAGAALLYPLAVVALAYASFVFLATHFAPITLAALQDLTGSSDRLLALLAWLGDRSEWWVVWTPLVAVICGGLLWYRSGRAVVTEHAARGWLSRLGSPRGLSRRHGQMASFAEILSLLVRQQIPLDEALVTAGSACGDAQLRDAAWLIAERLRGGQRIAADDPLLNPFPPLLAWLIASGGPSAVLGRSLAELGERYRDRAARAALWRTVYFPIVITAVVGGSVVLLQALVLFVSLCQLWFNLGNPS